MLNERGYDVKVSTYYDIDFYKKQLDDANVPNELIPGAGNTKRRILAVRSYFRKEKPDWVIAYQETPSLVACAAKVLGCSYRLIVSERNTTQVEGMNERVRFFLYHWADMIVPNSYSQEKYLAEHHPWMKEKLTTITNFVDLEYFSYVKRQKRNIPEIVVAASIWRSKNTLGFIDALKLVVEKGYNFHVSWYGKSELNIDYFNQCQRKIEELGLCDFIELKEKTKEICEVYHNSSFLCLPSFYEGTPNVICEAISTGLPVICSNVCDNQRYVKDNVNGFLFAPNCIEEMASSLIIALCLPASKYLEFQDCCRNIAVNNLSTEKFVNSYLEILQS